MIYLNLLTQKIKPYWLGLAFLGAALLITGLATVTSLLSWQQNLTEMASAQAELDTLTSRKNALDKLLSSKVALSQDKELLDAVLASDPSVPIVMTQVQQIASGTGVALTALQFSEVSAAKEVTTGKSIKLQASVGGPYTSIQNFLHEVENSGRLLMVDSLRFAASVAKSNPTAGGGSAEVTATLSINSPYFDEVGVEVANTNVLDLISPEFTKLIATLKTYRIYSTVVDESGVGKSNPFQ